MDAQLFFDEVIRLSPAAQDEVRKALTLAATAIASASEYEYGRPHDVEQTYRFYLNVAQWLTDHAHRK